jgi:hypothetical protein
MTQGETTRQGAGGAAQAAKISPDAAAAKTPDYSIPRADSFHGIIPKPDSSSTRSDLGSWCSCLSSIAVGLSA